MDDRRSPFDVFKNLPHFNEKFLKDVTGMDFSEPAEVLKHLGQVQWPPVDVFESYSEIIVIAEIPGLMSAADVTAELKGNVLKLEGEKVSEPEASENIKVHRQERNHGKFNRSVTLPVEVNGKLARAVYRRGLLEIRFTKLADSKARTLNIDFEK